MDPVNGVVKFASGTLFSEEHIPQAFWLLTPVLLKVKLLWQGWRYYHDIEPFTDKNNFYSIIGSNSIDFLVNKFNPARCIAYLLIVCFFEERVASCWQQIKISSECRNNAFWGRHLITVEAEDNPKGSGITHKLRCLFPSATRSLKNLYQRIHRTLYWEFIHLKCCLLMPFKILDLIDALLTNPLNPHHRMRVGKVIINGEDMVNRLMANQEYLRTLLSAKEPVISKLLKKSAVDTSRIDQWLQRSIKTTKAVKGFAENTGDGLRIMFSCFLMELGLEQYIPKPNKDLNSRPIKDLTHFTTSAA